MTAFSCATGSYDRTCKVWSTETGEEKQCLTGHKNVVYCLVFDKTGFVIVVDFNEMGNMRCICLVIKY